MTRPMFIYDTERRLHIDVGLVEPGVLDEAMKDLENTGPTLAGTTLSLSGIDMVPLEEGGFPIQETADKHLYALQALLKTYDKSTDRCLIPHIGRDRLITWIGVSMQEYLNSDSPVIDQALESTLQAMVDIRRDHSKEQLAEEIALEMEISGELSAKAFGYEVSLEHEHEDLTEWRFPSLRIPGGAGVTTLQGELEGINLINDGCLYITKWYNIDHYHESIVLALDLGRLAYFASCNS